jgi:hypothetical protein
MEGIEEQSRVDGRQIVLIVLIVVVGLGLIGGGIWVSQKALSDKKAESPVTVPAEVSEPTKAVEARSTPSLERKELKVEVLNGSGVAGQASKVSQYLEGLGYQDIKTANAKRYDYVETVVQIKESKKAYLEMVKGDVGKKYALAGEIETLEEKIEFDVVIIAGKK